MFRIPILFVLAGITGFMLYKNEKQRVPVQGAEGEESEQQNSGRQIPMLGREQLPRAPVFNSDEEFSDSDASLSDLDLRRR